MKRRFFALGERWMANPARRKTLGLVLLLLAGVASYGAYRMGRPRVDSTPVSTPAKPYHGEPVSLNLPPEIVDGFRGEIHPLLHGPTNLELAAGWAFDESEEYKAKLKDLDGYFSLDLKPAMARQTYTAPDFSALLPEKIAGVGQTWSLNPDKLTNMLRQFHPSASMHLSADGRRFGPDGAFAILRAVSPSYLDISLRVHAEFDVTTEVKDRRPAWPPVEQSWYTPAYFSGRMILNRDKGTVEYFRLGVPTDLLLNVHLTVRNRTITMKPISHFMGRVERMEICGGAVPATLDAESGESIAGAEADRRLQSVFYKFMEIHWRPFEQVLAEARDENKPILAVVLWGNLDDQSC
jgi:hypothetical protein